MNRLELLRIFSAAVEAPSFREAATRLGLSPQVVTRAVRTLEAQFGEPLFHRSTRAKQTTALGQALAAGAREAVAAVDQFFDHGRAAGSAAAGRVRITAPAALGRPAIVGALAPLLAAHPGLQVDLRLSDAVSDAVDEGIDVGIRVGALKDKDFVARPAAKLAFFVCAAPRLVLRTRAPRTPDELLARPCTALIDRNSGRPWPYVFAGGQRFVHPAPAFTTDDAEAECEAVLAGLAYAQLPAHLAVPHLRSGRLLAVLEAHSPEPWPVTVYRPRRAPVPARVRLVFDRLVAALGDERWLPQRV